MICCFPICDRRAELARMCVTYEYYVLMVELLIWVGTLGKNASCNNSVSKLLLETSFRNTLMSFGKHSCSNSLSSCFNDILWRSGAFVLYARSVTQVSVFGPHVKTFTQCQIAYLSRCKIRPSCAAGHCRCFDAHDIVRMPMSLKWRFAVTKLSWF